MGAVNYLIGGGNTKLKGGNYYAFVGCDHKIRKYPGKVNILLVEDII